MTVLAVTRSWVISLVSRLRFSPPSTALPFGSSESSTFPRHRAAASNLPAWLTFLHPPRCHPSPQQGRGQGSCAGSFVSDADCSHANKTEVCFRMEVLKTSVDVVLYAFMQNPQQASEWKTAIPLLTLSCRLSSKILNKLQNGRLQNLYWRCPVRSLPKSSTSFSVEDFIISFSSRWDVFCRWSHQRQDGILTFLSHGELHASLVIPGCQR